MYTPTILQSFYQKKKKKTNSLTQIQIQSQSQTQTQIHIHNYSSTLSSSAVGSKIFIIDQNAMVRYDTWSSTVVARSAMLFPHKKFATAVISGKIYATGDGSRTDAVEEYNSTQTNGASRWAMVKVWMEESCSSETLAFAALGASRRNRRWSQWNSEIQFFFIQLKFSQETNKKYLYN